ncbi:hypothetical protein KUCAC02_035275 [Chaenocephalus aceratus]|nr:hypothetical protein KUCAC02_035275 [Chaenocephalus aceratus]
MGGPARALLGGFSTTTSSLAVGARMAWPSNKPLDLNQTLSLGLGGGAAAMSAGLENFTQESGTRSAIKDKNWPALLILVIIALTIGGNILVILAVSLEKKLQNATNFFLRSLAVADMLVGILVMPVSLINILYDYAWPLPSALCPIWIYLDVLFSTASIMHLCAISLDRYVAIRNPIEHSRFNSRTKAMMKIAAVWTISIVLHIRLLPSYKTSCVFLDPSMGSAPLHAAMIESAFADLGSVSAEQTLRRKATPGLTFQALSNGSVSETSRDVSDPSHAHSVGCRVSMPIPVIGLHNEDKVFVNGSCVLNEERFMLIGSFVAFFIPLVIMVVSYCLTIQVLQRQAIVFLCESKTSSQQPLHPPAITLQPPASTLPQIKTTSPSDSQELKPPPLQSRRNTLSCLKAAEPGLLLRAPQPDSISMAGGSEVASQLSSPAAGTGRSDTSGCHGRRGMMQAIKNERRASKKDPLCSQEPNHVTE